MKAGIQLYLFRKLIKTPAGMAEVISRLADMGYDGIEPFHPFVLSPAAAARAAGRAKIINPHIEAYDLRHPAFVSAWAQEAGAKSVCFSRLVPFYKVFGLPVALRIIDRARGELEKHGIALCYHNHRAELKGGIDSLLRIAARGAVCELDAFWAQKAGADLHAVFSRLGEKVKYLHLKDETQEGKMCALGDGVCDLKTPVNLAASCGCEWAIADIDSSEEDAFETAQKSLAFLRSL